MSKRGIINLTIILYCVVGLIIYHFHSKFILKPNTDVVTYELPYEWNDINIPISYQTTMHLLQLKPKDSAKGVVIYFGGSKGNVWSQKESFSSIPSLGYEVIAMDYPGYGSSMGQFLEDSIYFRALTTYQFARARFEPQQIVLMGEELGSAVASYIATKRDAKAVILKNPISHYKDFVPLKIYPLERMLNFKFPTRDFVKEIIAPIYLLKEDNKVPKWLKAKTESNIHNILN